MCGRYTLYDTKALGKRFDASTSSLDDLRDNYNVAPSQRLPIITQGENGRTAELMKWGITRTIKDKKLDIINTRDDKAFGFFWKKTVLTQRCIVPARGFYEWKKLDGQKLPYFIHPKDQDLFGFAGIYSILEDVEGHKTKSFSIMTTQPNKEMEQVHNRMPVILTPGNETSWLEPTNSEQDLLAELLTPYVDGGLELYRVSSDVNSPRNNDKHLLYPVSG